MNIMKVKAKRRDSKFEIALATTFKRKISKKLASLYCRIKNLHVELLPSGAENYVRVCDENY